MRDEVRYLCPDCAKDYRPGIPLVGVLPAQFDYAAIQALQEAAVRTAACSPPSRTALSPLPVGHTPFFPVAALGKALGFENVWLKNDGLNPSASLKDRASFLVVAEADRLKEPSIVTASTGNAASALAAVCAAAGSRRSSLFPKAPPEPSSSRWSFTAPRHPVRGSYDDAFRLSLEYTARKGGLNRNTAYHPLTIEGKKTSGWRSTSRTGSRRRM